MIAWINFTFLLFATLLLLYYYMRSVNPATLEKVLGPTAYTRCGRDRIAASVFELIITINYVIYYFYPLQTPLPDKFPWAWWISAVIAVFIAIPALALMLIGVKHAGEETLLPKKEHTMYGGIYSKIRHPQALGEWFLFWVIAFLLHSPFLVLFSLVYIPIFIMMCFTEDLDLLWRYGDAYAEYYKNTGAFWPKRS